jgi:hypothetical protein
MDVLNIAKVAGLTIPARSTGAPEMATLPTRDATLVRRDGLTVGPATAEAPPRRTAPNGREHRGGRRPPIAHLTPTPLGPGFTPPAIVRFDPYGEALRALQARPGEWHDAGQVPSSTPGTLRRRGCQIAARPGDGKGSVRLYVRWAGDTEH